VFPNRDVEETIRHAEIAGIRRAIEATCRVAPETEATCIDVAGGLAAFTGIESPLSQVYGVGAHAPITRGEVATITDFFESRGAVARVFVAATADPSLAQALADAGYVQVETENVLFSRDVETHARRDDRVAIAQDIAAWARTSAAAFLEADPSEPIDDRIAWILASSEGTTALEVRQGGSIVATAAMDVRGECAALFGGSTLPAFRRQGWHGMLIRDRIARARDAGAHLLRATAKPESSSEGNFHRLGFVSLHTRELWERRAG
jgi:GNAT superfamily N-acetyltransferase